MRRKSIVEISIPNPRTLPTIPPHIVGAPNNVKITAQHRFEGRKEGRRRSGNMSREWEEFE